MATSKTFGVWGRISRPRATGNGRTRPFDAFRESTYPPPYPDGWYRVAASADIGRGEAVYIEVHFSWFADKSISRILASYVVGNWVSQWRRDVAIWENKIYRQKPLLTKSDGPVHRMRQWYQQFYAK